MNEEIKNFNLRVYGILLNEGSVLVTDENRGGIMMTKFPGGGLEKGEGLTDCLIREFREELDIEIRVGDFFYVNEFLQVSAFSKQDQLLSFYYKVTSHELEKIPLVDDLKTVAENEQHFRWVDLRDLDTEWFRFPIDKVVCEMLKKI